jgi:hypothetical protein
MAAIDRPAINSNVGQVAVQFELLLRTVVAWLAQAL